ncbi:hypothetical protein FEM48_Zijuj01G0094200 [Ziziphus jujuba var. spinosa]|uniref:Uncharacterized protein n=1 Tax=Ziziphus jujuba var. spinosa TaxID=714518 RepID=A0A978W0F6_ZIZJJ|nr:hypothetical protein FEM48_Zijuj01G0094200 [Ziziphus jujuba var. spinosa]
MVSKNCVDTKFGASRGSDNDYSSSGGFHNNGGFHNQFQAFQSPNQYRVAGFHEPTFESQVFNAVQQILGRGRGKGRNFGRGGGRNSKPTCQICQTYGHSAAYCYKRQQQAINQPFEVNINPYQVVPSQIHRLYNSNNLPPSVVSSGYNKDLPTYSQPSNSQIQGHLIYTNDASIQ